MDNTDSLNKPDTRGVHNFRFKWRSTIDLPLANIKSIWLKIEDSIPKYYFEIIVKDQDVLALNEIFHIKILKTIKDSSKSFKIIGAKGRHVIIGEIDLSEFKLKKKLVLSTLSDWRYFLKTKKK